MGVYHGGADVGCRMWGILLASLAWGAPSLQARLAEVAPLRADRLMKDAPAIPPAAYAEVEKGEIATGVQDVTGYAAKKAWGVAIVDVPIARYWAAINDDPAKKAEGLLQHVKVLAGGVCSPHRTVFQFLPVWLASDRWWVAKITVNQVVQALSKGRVREMEWQSVPFDLSKDPQVAAWARQGVQVAFTKGAWWLVDLDGAHTLVEYYAWSDPGGHIPAGLASRFAAGSISGTVRDMADIARGDPGCPIE